MPKTKKIVKSKSSTTSRKRVVTKKPVKKIRRLSTKRTSSRNTDLYNKKIIIVLLIAIVVFALLGYLIYNKQKNTSIDDFKATPYNVVRPLVKPNVSPKVLISPSTIKSFYNLPSNNRGTGTIVIIDAFDDPTAEADLATFSNQYGLSACTTANGCFQKYKMSANIPVNNNWAIEDSLDIQWAHAIAPGAKILLVEAKSDNGIDLINALNYVKTLPNIRSVSLSWGGNEFSTESSYGNSLINNYGATYFVASGDSGHGTSWPAVSVNVIGVGGTTLNLNLNGTFKSETAWSGSSGGVSKYIKEPNRQIVAKINYTNGYRATPDVSYNADPNSGYAVYDSTPYNGYRGWFQVGGTSAGAPQWAAINTLSNGTITNNKIYTDALVTNQAYFRDITVGNNGSCGILCNTSAGFDYVTGWGSPKTTTF